MSKVRRGLNFQFLLVVLFVSACQQKSNTHDQFTGRWVASYFIDSLSLSNISTIPFGATEISLPDYAIQAGVPPVDRITMWNEDVEGNWTYPTTWHGDTLITLYNGEASDRILLLKDGQLIFAFRDVSVHYCKVDSNIVATADALGVTAVRILVNRVLSQQSFTDEETKKTIQFKEDGRVSGLKDFVRYYITIAGDNANIDDCTSITFFDVAGKLTKWGMKGKPGKVELYTLRLLTEPDEKPWYEIDSLACRLAVQ